MLGLSSILLFNFLHVFCNSTKTTTISSEVILSKSSLKQTVVNLHPALGQAESKRDHQWLISGADLQIFCLAGNLWSSVDGRQFSNSEQCLWKLLWVRVMASNPWPASFPAWPALYILSKPYKAARGVSYGTIPVIQPRMEGVTMKDRGNISMW